MKNCGRVCGNMKKHHTRSKIRTEHKTFRESDEMMLDAVKELIKSVNVNRKYDIPYVAGYSKDGKTVYIDKDVPRNHRFNKKLYSLEQFLVVHEVVEKIFEDKLHSNYFYAHQLALRLERQSVEAHGIDWKEYDDFMQQWIKEVDHEKIKIVPHDLDLKPYYDSKDYALIKHMENHMEKDEISEMVFLKSLTL